MKTAEKVQANKSCC